MSIYVECLYTQCLHADCLFAIIVMLTVVLLNIVAPFNDDTMTILALYCQLCLMRFWCQKEPNYNMFLGYFLVKLDIIWCCEDIGQYCQESSKSYKTFLKNQPSNVRKENHNSVF